MNQCRHRGGNAANPNLLGIGAVAPPSMGKKLLGFYSRPKTSHATIAGQGRDYKEIPKKVLFKRWKEGYPERKW